MKWRTKIIAVCTLFALFVYLKNSMFTVNAQVRKPSLLAHRGLGQNFRTEGLTSNTNTASRIFAPEHPFIENTIAGIDTAFKLGAAIVEFDIHTTRDGNFAVFHDEVLEFRTNGHGRPEEYTMEALKKLDIGYGYTADTGKTFPFRGKGVGMMPTLNEILLKFPEKRFLIHIKDNEQQTGVKLFEVLKTLRKEQLQLLTVYGGERPVSAIKELMPELRVTSRKIIERALKTYELLGWTGYIPKEMRNTELHIPLKYAHLLWGWPQLFQTRMQKVNTVVVLVKGDGKFSEGFDNIDDLKDIPTGFTGVIWTNRIDRIYDRYR